MPDILGGASWLPTVAKYSTPLCIVASFVIFGPDAVRTKLGLDMFLQEYDLYVGIFFLLTFFLTVFNALQTLIELAKKCLNKWLRIRDLKKQASSLMPEEKEIMRRYITGDTVTLSFDGHEANAQVGNLQELIGRGLIYEVARGARGERDMNINREVLILFRENPEYLELD